MNELLKYRPATVRIVGIYALFGFLWIYTSDTALGWLVQDPYIMVKIAIYKGGIFIFFTSLLLYFLINRYNRNLAVSESALQEQVKSLLESQTERKQAEKLLLNEKALLRSVIDSTTDLIYFKDCNGIYIGCNKAAEKFIGLPENEQIGKSDFDFLDHEIAATASKFDQKVIADGVPVHIEEQVNSPIAGNLILDTVKAPIIGSDGQPIGLVGISRDITERKQSEIALQNSERNFRSLIGVAPLPIAINDDQGNITYLNEKFKQTIGYTLDDIATLEDWWPLAYPDEQYRQSVNTTWQKNIDDSRRTSSPFKPMEIDVVCKDASVRTFMCSATPLEENYLGSHLVVFYDITARKKNEQEKLILEQQLQHTQKLESLGVLSGGIAHDFNNILAIIMGYAALIKMDYETAQKNIPEIEKAAERAASLCRQMMAYAGKAQLTKAKVNIWMLVDEMVTMLKSTLPKNTVIKPDLSTDIPFIDADASQLRQVVMNLIINASEAIGTEQGEVNIYLSKANVTAGKTYTDYHGTQIPSGDYVCLEVTDNGYGMDDETKWRIFEPFYTTKFTGRGLGMSAVLGIIKSHDGALQLFSKLGKGTTFKVYLPVLTNDHHLDEDQAASVPSTPWQGSGTILLVEDEDQVREIAKELLEIFGFRVLEAVNGKEGLEIYQKNASEITLVLTDMGMPVMDGYELFHRLKNLNPELPIIVSSGYGDVEVSSRIGSDNIAGIISKPYNHNKLREVLKGVVDRTASAVALLYYGHIVIGTSPGE